MPRPTIDEIADRGRVASAGRRRARVRCGIVVALVAGGVLSASVNNLPAAAVGAVWLVGSPVSIVVAFLIGMNVAALATPHGSAATMLARSIGARAGVALPSIEHVRTPRRYAVAGSVGAASQAE